ncbi:G3E family GTPase [Kineococcus xinjiangensis]|uniref:G3E family GTPase n=1 Tax=Kineococcus xinjiangensis TaxID=512762 RepID=A0A2S6II28_9ACTN|nr:GTP-binding protein [Kineococcus xinjiangensis]PPK93873.1 G3E family GTPase [Kineococcus xinjiangensis]
MNGQRDPDPRLPVTVVAAMDAVLRESLTAGALCDVGGVVVLRYDLGPRRADGLRRTVSDASGVVEDVHVPLEHACLGCALREDVLPTLAAIAASGRWEHALLALPVTAEPVAAVQALVAGEVGGTVMEEVVRVAGVVAVADADTLLADAFGDDLLEERGLALAQDDRRAVGEALVHQLEEADVVVLDGEPSPATTAALRHLCVPALHLLRLHEDTGSLLRSWRGAAGLDGRSDLRRAAPSGAPDGDGAWTLELSSPRPFHPQRLLDRLEELGAGRLRARGVFWLPGRPDTVCAWDGAGGQLSIGDLGTWEPGEERRTHLVVTGLDARDRDRIRAAFPCVLATPTEQAAVEGIRGGDGFEDWLGPATADVLTGAHDDG